MKKLRLLAIFIFFGASITINMPSSARALSGSEFQAGRIIDDSVFFNGNAMEPNSIQAFLNSKLPVCDTWHAKTSSPRDSGPPYTCLKDYAQDTSPLPAEAGLCNGFSAGRKSAAQIIHEVGASCGISQKVILITLEKEQSLVTDTWPWAIQYDSATGYACPDTAACDPSFAGFFKQVYYGARQFKKYARDESSFRYRANRDNYIQYNPNTACGGTNVFIQNQATAGLYNYTPYQPNAAALGNLYGTGDGCSAYGNRNFWRMFNDWFGSTFVNCNYTASGNHGLFRLYNPTTKNHLYTSSISEACSAVSAGFFYDGQVVKSDATQGTPVYRLERWGRYLFTKSANERDSAVWNYGYRYEGVAFYSTDSSSSEAKAVYRLSNANGYYLYTISAAERDSFIQNDDYKLDGIPFNLRENPGITVSPVYRLRNQTGRFLFTIDSKERDGATAYYGFVNEGVGFNAITQLNPITVPIYRLSGPNGYILTTSLQERTNAFRAGFREEGVAMYTYGSQTENLTKIYRLRNPSGSYLYTASEAERHYAAQYLWFIYEGIGFRTP